MKKECKVSACLIPMVAVFIFLFGYNCLVHGHLLMADYAQTPALWRTDAEMQQLAPMWFAYYVALAAVLTCWFKKTKSVFACAPTPGEKPSCCPIKSGGCCFGLKLGLLMGLLMACGYLYMPISSTLAIKWFFTGLFEGLGAGMVLGMTCKASATCSTDKGMP